MKGILFALALIVLVTNAGAQVTVTDNGTNAPAIGPDDTGHMISNNRFGWDSGEWFRQSFTVAQAGKIKSIYIGYNAFDDGDDITLTLSVNDVEVQSGIFLDGNNFSGTEATDGNGGPFYWMAFDFSSLNVAVNAGTNSFKMVATAGTEATGSWPLAVRKDNGDNYTGGVGTGQASPDIVFAVTVFVPPKGTVLIIK